jgi:orotidine-5'-phosphate decarboxylase
MGRHFGHLLEAQWKRGHFVCVGLDIDLTRLPNCLTGTPVDRCLAFAQAIVDSTRDFVAAYKPNISYFEALGADGLALLQRIVAYIHSAAPDVPVIIDAKRADIASTNDGYVTALFDYLGADATTLHPYLGHEALRPFLARRDKGYFILCRTSNPGAGELQDLEIDGRPLFLHVAELVDADWNVNGNCGLVAGATYPAELARIRNHVRTLPLLVPGIGAQGGDVEATVRACWAAGQMRVLINSSRAVLYASSGEDFADAASKAVQDLHREISEVLEAIRVSP